MNLVIQNKETEMFTTYVDFEMLERVNDDLYRVTFENQLASYVNMRLEKIIMVYSYEKDDKNE